MFTFERLRASLSSQKRKRFFATALVAVFAIATLLGSTELAFAQETPAEATNAAAQAQVNNRSEGACEGNIMPIICEGVAGFLGLIADLIGRMILLIVSVLIAFAQYNGFSDALPVEQGWIVVRDTTNMFFIIVLLLTAFATVIGRDEFHYEKVLPKLLLQAVLINFSKTLIQLLIDFSQVIMLTFVNAFAQSAAGNFVYALGLDKMMQLGSTTNGIGLANIIIAYGLAIIFMIIALGVVTILTCYLVYRIVALWITLILAPLAFFATALPGKLQAGMSSVTTKYWERLTGLLTGGPVIAFFLWLTLAITQKSSQAATEQSINRGGGLSAALNLTRPNSGAVDREGIVGGAAGVVGGAADTATGFTFGFITQLGDSNHVMSFVVGIALMLAALDTAVASAAAMGGLAAWIGKKTKGYAMGAAKAPFNFVDKRLDITGKASRAGLATVGRVPGLRGLVRPTLQKGLVFRRKQASEEAGDEVKRTEEVKKYATDAELKTYGKTYGGFANKLSTLGTRTSRMKVSEILATNEMRDNEAKRNKTSKVDLLRGLAKSKGINLTEQEAKAGSETMAKAAAYEDQGKLFRNQLQMAKSMDDSDTVEKLEKVMKANPLLAAAGEQRKKAIEDLVNSPDSFKDIDSFNANNGDLLTQLMITSGGWEVDKATNTLKLVDDASWERKKMQVRDSKNTDLIRAMQDHESFVKNSGEKKVDELRGIQHRLNPKDNNMQTFALRDSSATTPNMVTGLRVRNATQDTALKAVKKSADPNNPSKVDTASMRTAVRSGATLRETLDAAGYEKGKSTGTTEFFAKELGNSITSSMEELKQFEGARDAAVDSATANLQLAINNHPGKNKGASDDEKRDLETLKAEKKRIKKKIESDLESQRQEINSRVASSSRDMLEVLGQVGAEGVGSDIQDIVLGELFANGGAQIARDNDALTREQKAAFEKAVKEAVNRYDNIKELQASGKATTKHQDAIMNGVLEMHKMKKERGFSASIKNALSGRASTRDTPV